MSDDRRTETTAWRLLGWLAVQAFGVELIAAGSALVGVLLGLHPSYTSPEGYLLTTSGMMVGAFSSWCIRQWI